MKLAIDKHIVHKTSTPKGEEIQVNSLLLICCGRSCSVCCVALQDVVLLSIMLCMNGCAVSII